ncbi:MAG: hypothetical protein AYK18_16770 [Theionarchaea archaeon DG-70]|nr:MAG: hypothetical protein AYK18_16770 [Theionarchaea archaeon DG-70]
MSILQEDLPPGISVLIVGPPGSGKSILSQQLVYQQLKQNKSAIYMGSKSQISAITFRKKFFTWDIGPYVDNDQLTMVEIKNVTNPTELNINLAQAITESKKPLSLVVVDSLTVLMVGIDQGKIMKFTEGLAGKLQDQNVTVLLLATPTEETQDFLTKMKSLVSSVIEIRLEEGRIIRRFIRIFKFQDRKHSTQWFPFEITDNGIQFAASSVKIPDTFLFDLEGTLVTMNVDVETLRQEIDTLLVEHGYPQELLDADRSPFDTVGQAIHYMRTHHGDWKGVKKTAESYLEQQGLEAASQAVCVEGAKPLLEILKKLKKKVGVITRYNREAAVQALKKCGLSTYVDILLTRDDVKNENLCFDLVLQAMKALDSIPERTIVLGDDPVLIEAGNEAGCYTVGVLTESGTRSMLSDADLILNSLKNLGKILTMVEQ